MTRRQRDNLLLAAIILLPLDRGAKGEGNFIKKGCKAFGINGFLNGR